MLKRKIIIILLLYKVFSVFDKIDNVEDAQTVTNRPRVKDIDIFAGISDFKRPYAYYFNLYIDMSLT